MRLGLFDDGAPDGDLLGSAVAGDLLGLLDLGAAVGIWEAMGVGRRVGKEVGVDVGMAEHPRIPR